MNIAQQIYRVARISGTFTLRSGAVSHTYFDKYRFESDPQLLLAIGQALSKLVPHDTDVLAGLEMGGIPIVTILSQQTGLPAVFVRKSAKEYGTCRYLEGMDITSQKLIFIEDVVSSGGAIIDAANMMREDGIHVNKALCVIDRESGGKEKLAEQGIELISLLTMSEIEASV